MCCTWRRHVQATPGPTLSEEGPSTTRLVTSRYTSEMVFGLLWSFPPPEPPTPSATHSGAPLPRSPPRGPGYEGATARGFGIFVICNGLYCWGPHSIPRPFICLPGIGRPGLFRGRTGSALQLRGLICLQGSSQWWWTEGCSVPRYHALHDARLEVRLSTGQPTCLPFCHFVRHYKRRQRTCSRTPAHTTT